VTDTNQKKQRITRSNSTRALMKVRAQERGQLRSDDVRERVHSAMKSIEEEMAGNGGIYPHNKGALSAAEVTRRAGVHPTTLFTPKQRELGTYVKNWLETIKTQKVVGRGPVRRELATRVADWMHMFDGLAQSHRDTELNLQQTQADLAKASADLDKVQRENERLQKLLNAAGGRKVVPIRAKKD
jgi:hypothetical protein